MAFRGEIGHIEGIESPWSNAAGVAKTLEEVALLARTGVGYIEDGSHCLEARKGNGWNPETGQRDRKDFDYNPETGEMHNSLGMPGYGMDALEAEMPEKLAVAHAHRKPYVLNVAPVSIEPGKESLELIRRGYAAGADGVLLNAGCPNVKGEDGQPHKPLSKSPRDFGRVLDFLGQSGVREGSLWVRISPQDSFGDMNLLCSYIKQSRVVSAVLTPNTWVVPMPSGPDDKPLLEVDVPSVGKSGPAVARDALVQMEWACTALSGSKVDVVCSSGIIDAGGVQRALGKGAVGAAGSTFFYISENGWADDTNHMLRDLAA